MRVVVDRAKCQTTGVCESIDPERFEVDADGLLDIKEPMVEESARRRVQGAVDACPTRALCLDDA